MTEPTKRATTPKKPTSQVEVDELKGAVVSLAGRVTSLSEALTTVNDLQRRQAVTEHETSLIKAKAVEAAKTAQIVEENLIPRSEHEERWRNEQQELIDLRLHIKRQTYIVGLIFFFLSLVALGIASGLMLHQQGEDRKQQKAACEIRLDNSKKGVVAYGNLLKSPTIQNDPTFKAFIQTVYDASVRGSKVVC